VSEQRYSQTQRRFFDLLMESQYWPPERMLAYQRQQLSYLLRHARDTVPFYRDRLALVFRGNEVLWDKWQDLPIVTRADLIERRSDMQAINLDPTHGPTKEFATSGSTGAPVTTTHNIAAVLAANATLFRMHRWHRLDWTKNVLRLEGENPSLGAYPEGEPGQPWGPAWDIESTGKEFLLNRLARPDQVFDFVTRKKIAYFRGGGTDLRMLAYEALRLDAGVHLDAAMARSVVITEYGEELVSKAFGAPTIPYYSSKEGHKMAHRCSASHNYHVASEAVFLEVLRPDGSACEPGETGRVVITPLFSYAQPLVRYEQGDLALVGEPCSCGRTLPVLANILGRVKHVFHRLDGRTVVPIIPAAPLMALDAQNYQIAQVDLRTIEVRYVPRDSATQGNEAPLAAAIRSEMGPEVSVHFRRLKAFEVPPGRKHLEYVSEMQTRH